MVGYQFKQEFLCVGAALRSRVEVEGGRQKQAVDGHVSVGQVDYLIQHHLD